MFSGPNGSKATSEHQGRSALEITAAGPPIAGPEEKRRSPAMKVSVVSGPQEDYYEHSDWEEIGHTASS